MDQAAEKLTVRLLDRHIAGRFLWNFVVLFVLLFVLAISIDVILQLDRFLEAGQQLAADGRVRTAWLGAALAIFDFHGPRIFQFYAYLLGLVAVAAAGFTLAQMHRARELTAMLSTGISLHRVALPIVIAAMGLNGLQLLNQELVVPRLASRLIRDHGGILGRAVDQTPLPMTPDGRGNLIMADDFDAQRGELQGVVIIQRNERGGAVRRITASTARWDLGRRGWRLVDGLAIGREVQIDQRPSVADGELLRERVDLVESDLDPQSIVIRRAAQFAQMLSLRQVSRLEAVGGVDRELLGRIRWSRFAGVATNMVVLILVLPTFLLREPANMLRQSVMAALIAIPAMLGALVGMLVALPDIPAVIMVFLPVLVITPIAIGRAMGLKT